MKLETLNEATKLSPKDRRLAVQKGGFSKDVAFAVKGELTKIIKKHTGEDWKRNSNFLDQSIEYTGDDVAAANKIVDTIIGDLYGFFVDGAQRERVRVVKSNQKNGPHEQEVYTVTPLNKVKPQIEFFKFKDEPKIGITIDMVR